MPPYTRESPAISARSCKVLYCKTVLSFGVTPGSIVLLPWSKMYSPMQTVLSLTFKDGHSAILFGIVTTVKPSYKAGFLNHQFNNLAATVENVVCPLATSGNGGVTKLKF